MAKRSTKPSGRSPTVDPTCSCLVLCDDVVISHGLDKHRLDGIIGAITVPWVPHPAGGGVVYVRVSNVRQNLSLTVRLVSAEDDQPLWEIEAEILNRNEPLHVHTLVARVPEFLVSKQGKYVLEARHKGVPIASVPITIRARFSSPQPGDAPGEHHP